MFKMGSHDPFGHFKHKLGPIEGSRVKLAIWLPTTKSWEYPWFPCVKVWYDIPLESSQRGLQLCFIPHFNWRFAHKVMGPQILGILGLPLGSPKTKWHLGVGPMVRHIVYYKGEGGGFPQVWVVVSLGSLCLPVARPCTKVLQLCINQLVWFVQVCVNNWIACQFSSSHPVAPAHLFTLEVLWARESTRTPSPSTIFTFGLAVESIKELEDASNMLLEWMFKQFEKKSYNNLHPWIAKHYMPKL